MARGITLNLVFKDENTIKTMEFRRFGITHGPLLLIDPFSFLCVCVGVWRVVCVCVCVFNCVLFFFVCNFRSTLASTSSICINLSLS